MVRITKVYTRTGDQGQTSLAAGQGISKNTLRINVLGELDELNAHMGSSISELVKYEQLESIKIACVRIQNELFNLGAQVAVLKKDRRPDTPIIQFKDIELLEEEIDKMNIHLPTLSSFVLPGGAEVSIRLQIARAVCRRAERSMVALLEESGLLDGTELPYLNRLSDWLFVAARFSTYILGEKESLWIV